MKFKSAFSVISLSILLAVLCFQAFGQNTVSPQKRELIKELLVITDAVKTAEAAMAQMNQEMPKIMKQLSLQQAESSGLSASQRKEFEESFEATVIRMVKRMQEKMATSLNLAEYMEKVSLELYDKYFSESELKDMLAFYKTPTGKKTIEVMPKLMADSMQKSTEQFMPKMMSIINEIIAEELKIKK